MFFSILSIFLFNLIYLSIFLANAFLEVGKATTESHQIQIGALAGLLQNNIYIYF